MNHAAVFLFVVVVVLALIAIAAYFYSRERRSKLLREHFGPEYDRVVEKEKDVRRAEAAVVQNYRVAHNIAIRQDQGKASTEDLRKAVVHYRSLFDELLYDSDLERKVANR